MIYFKDLDVTFVHGKNNNRPFVDGDTIVGALNYVRHTVTSCCTLCWLAHINCSQIARKIGIWVSTLMTGYWRN